MRTKLWRPYTRQHSPDITTLLDTGAGGGNYASVAFIESVERTQHGGKSMISTRGKGVLRAANPTNSKVPPMETVGTCILPLTFAPVDRVFKVRVRVVPGLPFGLILGAAFMRTHNSVLLFAGKGTFRPTPDSEVVPFLEYGRETQDRPRLQEQRTAAVMGTRTGRRRCPETGAACWRNRTTRPRTRRNANLERGSIFAP